MRLSATASRGGRTALALAALLTVSLPTLAQWPQWRGPEGRGVAPDAPPLPERWEADGDGVRWRTALPGAGTSSPIVADGRVFVTTAYEGPRSRLQRALILGAVLALGLFAVWRLLAPPRGPRWLLLLSLVFVALAVGLSVAPELFYPTGKPGRTWRVTGALALIGLAAAVGCSPALARWRLPGIAALLAGAAFVAALTPPSQIGPAPLGKRLVFVLPALLAAAAYLRGYLGGRSRRPEAAASSPGAAGALALLSLLVFVPPNYLSGLLRAVVCLDLDSGAILWERAAFAAPPEQRWPGGTYATPTPATDGELVFAYFGAGLAAFDFDGERRWVRRFPAYSRYARYGAGASPVLTEDAVIVVQESEAYQGGPASWIAAFDKRSGRTLWRITPERARDSYNTPLLVRSDSGGRLLTASWGFLAAYDTATGAALWSLDYPMMQVVASMARSGDLVAVSGGAHGDKKLMVLRLADAASPPEIVWESARRVARVPSPVFYDGLLFTLTDNGILSCYDAESGEELWKSRLDGEHFASLLAGDGKVYAVNTEGATSVVAAARDYRLIAVNALGETVRASPAAAAGRLLIRTAEGLVCVEGSA